MPVGNNFQHAVYSRTSPEDRVEYREFSPTAPVGSPPWEDAMALRGSVLASANVRLILFLHGSYLGSDLFGAQRLDEVGGLKRGYSRGIPGMEALLALMREGSNGIPNPSDGRRPPYLDDAATKASIDAQQGDAANFSETYLLRFGEGINRDLDRPIICRRLLWSSEQHHLGRVEGACRLIDRLITLGGELPLTPSDRVLILAHGQAGLLTALLSNLLAAEEISNRNAVLSILETYVRATRPDDSGGMESLRAQIHNRTFLHGAAIDVVTFGTPVRYGWDPSGLGRLLHVVNHRPMRADGKRWLAKMELPQVTMEMPMVWGGDYVQQLAVAGTDAMPPTALAMEVNKAIWEILEPYEGFERWLECARKAVRCQNDGRCLLIDYRDASLDSPRPAREHIYGHAAYTRIDAMLFTATEIVRALYAAS